MTVAEFRRKVREAYPKALISVRTVSFQDLARASKKCLIVAGQYDFQDLRQINTWAKDAGVLPFSRIWFAKTEEA